MSDDEFEQMKLLMAEMFGRDGDNGRFSALEDDMKTMKIELAEMSKFRIRALTYASMLIVVAGFLAALVSKGAAKLLGL